MLTSANNLFYRPPQLHYPQSQDRLNRAQINYSVSKPPRLRLDQMPKHDHRHLIQIHSVDPQRYPHKMKFYVSKVHDPCVIVRQQFVLDMLPCKSRHFSPRDLHQYQSCAEYQNCLVEPQSHAAKYLHHYINLKRQFHH